MPPPLSYLFVAKYKTENNAWKTSRTRIYFTAIKAAISVADEGTIITGCCYYCYYYYLLWLSYYLLIILISLRRLVWSRGRNKVHFVDFTELLVPHWITGVTWTRKTWLYSLASSDAFSCRFMIKSTLAMTNPVF